MTGRRLVPVVPTALTLGNLVFGFLATARTLDAMLSASEGGGPWDPGFSAKILQACWFIVFAMLCDALDGRVARMMGAATPFGSQLDSLADMVTFGVAPALIAKVVYSHTMGQLGLTFHAGVVTLLASLYLVGAALRLARFTVATDLDEESHDMFLGLPSPAAAATVITACFFAFEGRSEIGIEPPLSDTIGVWVLRSLPGLAAGLGLLMVSHVRYVHLFQRYVRARAPAATVVKMVLLAWIVVAFKEWVLFAGSLVYVLGGIALWARARAKGRRVIDELPAPAPDDDEAEAAG